MGITDARVHLDLARKQWDDAQTDSWEPVEPASCVTNAFYAYENIVVALAEARGVKWKKNHYDKAEIAAQFAKNGTLTKDISALMLRLNALRKDVSYGEPGEDLGNEDLETLVSDLESMIDEADEIISDLEENSPESE
jgi:uncharacterized protein (UPF0332 family)